MDLQICSACSSPTPVGSSIRLKTCQHSFCVLCLKYALIFGGAPDLQCPYPQGTFECGSKPNEAEVQYILEYDEDGRQDGGETGGNMVAIGALENALDRVLSIGLDEFPREVTEELPRVNLLNLNGVDDTKGDSEVEANGAESALESSEEKLAGEEDFFLDLNNLYGNVDIKLSSSGSDQLVGTGETSNTEMNFLPDCGSDMLQGSVIDSAFNDVIITESDFSTPEEIPFINRESDETIQASIESKFDFNHGERPTQSIEGLETVCSEQAPSELMKSSEESQASRSDIGNNAGEVILPPHIEAAIPLTLETKFAGEPSTIVKDVSKGAIPKVRKALGQDSNDSSNASSNEAQPSEDQDLALALKLQEEESKIDMDLLLAVSDANLPPNMEPFECPVCYGQFKPYEGVTLAFCFHSFCKPCLAESVKHSDELEVTCPALVDGDVKCSAIVQDGAIRDLLTEEDFGRFQDRCLQTAEAVIPNTFHCLTPNCRGWVELIGEVEFFDCSICLVRNCVTCKAIHGNQSCQDYLANIRRKDDDVKSEATLKTMVETREGMRCPKCGVMITKIAGCDFMTCTTCKTGICWPTRGPRWGPAGQGDISGGCRCKVDNGRRCHPECEGCH
uniref:RanBP-type and C3HC4-type zinc finger-containing protein 1 n=1 Tax=Culex pipiens TaxID=7175 RepID=A0A8D8DUK6_CULPI